MTLETKTRKTDLKPGDRLVITHRYSDQPSGRFPMGTRVTVKAVEAYEPNEGEGDKVTVVNEAGDEIAISSGWLDKVGAPERPLIDFSGKSRATAREYALAAIASKMPTAIKDLFLAASNGESVDAYAFNDALTVAFRLGFTRCGSAAQRRVLQRQIGHLAHITQAVLEAHADNLPVYADTGVRSRKIEELTEALDLEKQRSTALIREKTEVEVKLSESRARFHSVKAQANDEIDRLLKIANVRDALLAETVADRNALAATLTYALELLEPAQVQRVLGYQDGVSA